MQRILFPAQHFDQTTHGVSAFSTVQSSNLNSSLLQAFATECGAIGWTDGIGFHVAGKRIRWCFYGVLARLLEIWIFVVWGLA